MSKTKTTKRALLSSVLAMLLCVTMLIGTTFAWFTDTASTAVNKIQAGNLDVEVDYMKPDGTWTSIEGASTLFSANLWEPGHTEVVYLRVKNVGDLGFNYKVLVTPVTENGGVNVNGESFKLSDYLVFGTTAPATSLTTYADRAAARTAVAGNGMGLNVNSLTKTGSIQAQGAEQYMALVVYMPETVGNEANYKTGTTPPTIELGIKVVATQLTAESDSFGNDYDSGAVNDSFYTVGAYYDYFPQVSVSAPVVAGGDTVITATGKLNKDDTTTTTLAKVTVPEGATLVEGTTELTVNVVPKDPAASTTTGTELVAEIDNPNRETANFDIKVEGIASSNTASINVEVFIGKGLSNVKVYHNGALINGTSYNAATGIVTFSTTSFSDFTAAYDVAAASIGDKTYGTLALAIAAAQTDDTVKLLKDVTLTSLLNVNKNITLDLDGKTISGENSTNIYVTAGILSVKNGVIDVSGEAFRVDGANNTTEGSLVLNLAPNVTVKSSDDCCVYIFGRATLNTEAKLYNNSEYTTIQTHGNHATTVVNVNGGVVKNVGGPAIYFANGKELNVSGGELTGTTAISAKGGKVTISGEAVLHAVGEKFDPTEAENSGSNDTGDAFYIEDNYQPAVTAKITGGTFISDNAKAVNMLFVNDQKGSTISITGGTFSSDPSAYLANGYNVNEENGRYVVYAGTIVCTVEELQNILTAYTSSGAGDNVVSITTDLRLADGEQWNPVRVQGYTGAGVITVNGNGHTIYGLNAPLFAGGFAGNSGIIVNDLTIDGAEIDDTYADQGLGAFVCSIDSMPTIELKNCHLKNSTITSTGGARVGGLIGWTAGYNNPNDGPVDTYITITNCSVEDCNITANGSVGAIIGHAGGNPATFHTITGCTVTGTTLNSTDDGGWRVGVVVGTANVGQVTISGTTVSGNTISQVGKTAPEHSNLYGRFVPGTTGTLTIDGVEIIA